MYTQARYISVKLASLEKKLVSQVAEMFSDQFR
jgi:hypothetical protein